MTRAGVGIAAIALGSAAVALAFAMHRREARTPTGDAQCGAAFVSIGARCCPSARAPVGRCEDAFDPPRLRVAIPETTALLGPSDWEAEGRVSPRTLHVVSFALDAYEATVGEMDAHYIGPDRARAASGVTRDEAARYCASKMGRLPTEDEWIAAAAGASARRYPWGDTGAVCRRAAWGLAHGPCSDRGDGPDTIGAHPDGDSPLGVHDLAGNVAEWVASQADGKGIARGGSWRTALAAELRTWARLELDPNARDDRVGVRCAYDSP